jgi:uncharacterized membrane protein
MSTDLLNAQAFQMTIVYAMLIFLIISAICIVIMLISISKQGDERRKFILIGILLADVSYTLFLERFTHFYIEDTPILYLGVVAIVFTISLFVNKQKHGN